MGSLPAPGYVTQVDIYFNDVDLDVIEIGEISSYVPSAPATVIYYIVWDEQDTVTQQLILDHVDGYGGAVPFAGAVAGFQKVDFAGRAVAGDPTGLDTTAHGPGTLVHFFKEAKVGGDATGLQPFNDDGLQEIVQFTTRAADSSPAPLGGTHFTVSDPSTDYYVWYNTGADADPTPGGTGIEVTITATDTAKEVASKTKDAILAATNDFYVKVIGNNITIISVAEGAATDATNGDTSFGALKVQDGADPTARSYTFTHYNGGFVDVVTVPGTTATFTDLLTSINGQMTNTTATIDGDGNLLFTTSGSGPNELVHIVDGDLFGNLEDGLSFGDSIPGTGTVYEFHVEVDGTVEKYTIIGEDAATFADLVAAMSTAMTGEATVTIDADDNILVTSDTTGNASSIKIVGVDGRIDPLSVDLWESLEGFAGFGIPQHGADDFIDSLFLTEGIGGDRIFNKVDTVGRGPKPIVGTNVNDSTAVYYDGSDWVRVIDDTPV